MASVESLSYVPRILSNIEMPCVGLISRRSEKVRVQEYVLTFNHRYNLLTNAMVEKGGIVSIENYLDENDNLLIPTQENIDFVVLASNGDVDPNLELVAFANGNWATYKNGERIDAGGIDLVKRPGEMLREYYLITHSAKLQRKKYRLANHSSGMRSVFGNNDIVPWEEKVKADDYVVKHAKKDRPRLLRSIDEAYMRVMSTTPVEHSFSTSNTLP